MKARHAPTDAELPIAGRADQRDRKNEVLTRGTPSVARTIADAVVIKAGDVLLLSEPDGQIPDDQEHGLGLYYHDCRYLCRYELRLGGSLPIALGNAAAAGWRAIFQLANPDISLADGTTILRETISLEWARELSADSLTLTDTLTLRNWNQDGVIVPIELQFGGDFSDVFCVRGLLELRPGTAGPPEWAGHTLHFVYHGADNVRRSLAVTVPDALEQSGETGCAGVIRLDARATLTLTVRLTLSETPMSGERSPTMPARSAPSGPAEKRATMSSDSVLVNQLLDRSFRDLDLLRTEQHGETYFAAGVPWFAALFGRDSLITSLQMLPFESRVAASTLRLLASYQGSKVDEWRDEQPGKILHELRVGELARTNQIPHTPYYGSIDSTPLFLLTLSRYVDWTGDLSLFQELNENVERALVWIEQHGDSDGDGYVDYDSHTAGGGSLINQGWKDSGDAMVDAKGRPAKPPIAPVEVQGYVYAAKLGIAGLYETAGNPDRAATLREEAAALRSRFNRDFWLADLGCYAMALEKGGRPLRVISSNPGHALWTGIADADKAKATASRLMADDMYSGWGIRTLSASEPGYTPISYHRGTVWPHDNAFTAAGFHRYGMGDLALRVLEGIIEAALAFEHERLPELFTGFARSEYSAPVRYPVACHPQAWAAGAVPFLVHHLLGLVPDAAKQRLRIVRPTLPPDVRRLELRGLRVGESRADLRFERDDTGETIVEAMAVEGPLNLSIELDATADY